MYLLQAYHIMWLLHPLKAMWEADRFPARGIAVISLFDGLGVAAYVLSLLGITVYRYYVSEIDDKRSKIAQ